MGKKLILKASAGTGKTYRLSLEYIGALLRGIDYREILVMTFTKKATSEIKERIVSFLYGICNDRDIHNEIETNLKNIYGNDFVLDDKKIRKIYQEISENRDNLKIYTIDAFTNMLFRNAIAPYLKLYKYEIIDDEENRDILLKTFQRLFESQDSFEVFREFLEDNSEKDMGRYITLISNVLSERWKFIVIGEKYLNREKSFAYGDIDGYVDDFYDLMCEIAELKEKEPNEIFKTAFQEFCEVDNKSEYIYENYELFLKNDPWHGNKIRSTKALNIEDIKEKMMNKYSELKSNLAKKMFNEKIVPYEKKLLKAITTIYSIYDEIKMREKRFTHTDISNYTFKYLRDRELGFVGEDGNLTDDFFDVIDGKITSIFIDEFQDTSILQWKILKNIIDKSEDIICVGDEKQSIYGWRGGEKRLFENLEMIIDGKKEVLDTCYRSRENIIKYVNKAFTGIANSSAEEYIHNRPWEYEPVNYIEKDEKGYVEVAVGDEENEALDILIDKIVENFNGNYKGVGIIARTGKTLKLIGDKLGEREISYTLESKTNIFDTESVRPIYSLIRWFAKGDYLAFLEFIRSDIVVGSANLLKELIVRREEVEKWIADEKGANIGIEAKVLGIVKELYHMYIMENGETGCLAYEMIKKLGVLETFNKKEDQNDIFTFYKLIREYRYFSDFLAEVEENPNDKKFKKESSKSEGISLLTIHKSKGLEFDTVFYYIVKNRKPGGSGGIKTYFKIDEKFENTVDFLITHGKFNSILDNIDEVTYLDEEREKESLEEINNLYVALTRPKKNLFVIIENQDTVEKEKLLTLIIPEPVGEIIKNDEELEKEEEIREDLAIDLCGSRKEYKISVEENYDEGREKIRNHDLLLEYRRVKGNIIHFFLENLDKWDEKNIEMAKLLTYSRFVSTVGKKELDEIFSKKNLEKLNTKCSELFSSEWDYVYREYTVYYKNEVDELEILRLDRLMLKRPANGNPGIVFIADYKTGGYGEEQIKKYEKAIVQYLTNNKINVNDYKIISKYIELSI
ncbi:RecBCD enzyme subunit RecB [Fusobacterium sp. DD29]|uniref:UvrD-helicase domain-containing protein n=1 Tax=unclassified Fusobacterium TaxID=2648384 RepID=UPI001B8C4914|nr:MULTISPECIES: UvrD-helicase domain-containing protein [unclassified Fusobacterium]MBR8700363.1 RecBCD enzyme subunit RecB [Fusobacterium sp. DD45]MBR8710056.1 RecBCD enzyme subunit RecB [Fusobacterium sp. DD28]MBR8748356.1 RecBCD enzyme subunit RecB [Fusobacterium sp. DD29]MBR8750634.1 RecBCD enzyme subunit RecB [Fusobacterium sp. DD26]MBR8760670.1 RecBCD enzyme subunit RecB [Fusobacterium sp. DD25]